MDIDRSTHLGTDADGGEDWATRRRQAIAAHAADVSRREAAEAAQARDLLAGFVREASARGIPPTSLRARSYDGRHRYRTALRGWYLRLDESVAVSEGAEFYVLTAPSSLRSAVVGAIIAPTRPKLVIGEGGRDGDRMTLRTLLDRRLGNGFRAPQRRCR